jgi:hypothetical protein
MTKIALALLLLFASAAAHAADPTCLTGPDSRVRSIRIERTCGTTSTYYVFNSMGEPLNLDAKGERFKYDLAEPRRVSFEATPDMRNPLGEDFPARKVYLATDTSSVCVSGKAIQDGDHCRGDYTFERCESTTYRLTVAAPKSVAYAVRRELASPDRNVTCGFFFDSGALVGARHPESTIRFQIYGDGVLLVSYPIELTRDATATISKKIIEAALKADEVSGGQTGSGAGPNSQYLLERKRAALAKLEKNLAVKVSATP